MNNSLINSAKRLFLPGLFALVLASLVEAIIFYFIAEISYLEHLNVGIWIYVLVSSLSIISFIFLTGVFVELLNIKVSEIDEKKSGDRFKRSNLLVIHEELNSANLYIDIMIKQIDGALKDAESGVLTAIVKVNQLDASYKHQMSSQAFINESNQSESLEILTDLLACLQFQDVVRQRLEQVRSALEHLDNHFVELDTQIMDMNWDGTVRFTLSSKINELSKEYVMRSQFEAHKKIAEIDVVTNTNQSVELF